MLYLVDTEIQADIKTETTLNCDLWNRRKKSRVASLSIEAEYMAILRELKGLFSLNLYGEV